MKTVNAGFSKVEQLLPEPLLLASREGQLLDANPAALELLQLTRSDLGCPIDSIFAETSENVAALLRQFSRSGDLTPAPARVRCGELNRSLRVEGALLPAASEDGTPTILLRLVPDTAGGTRFQILTEKVEHLNREIHARIRTEEELVNARTKLKEHASNLEAEVEKRTESLRESNQVLEEFTATMAHDLRTPVRSIAGFASLVEDELGNAPEETRNLLKRIQSSATRLDKMIQGLLAYGRLSQAELPVAPIDLKEQVHATLASLQQSIEGWKMDIRIEGNCPPVLGNSVILDQILSNLLVNALKFTPEGEEAKIVIGLSGKENHCILSIRDHGIGIAPETREQIMKPFQRGNGHGAFAKSGVGLGLAIVIKAIKRLNGDLTIESEPGKGSCFSISLPRAEGRE